MTAVWYTGGADARTISAAEWAAAGVAGASSVTWNLANGWSISTASFNLAQLSILAASTEFNVNGADGPRPGTPAYGYPFSFSTRRARTVAALGASISWNGNFAGSASGEMQGGLVNMTPQSILANLLPLLRGRFAAGGVFALGGYTTQQVTDTFLQPCINSAPDLVFFGDSPINDIGAGLTHLEVARKIKYQLDQLLAAGITPVIYNSKPNDGFNSTQRSTQMKYNKWLARYCEQEKILHVDIYSLFVNPANNNNVAGTCSDTVHPSGFGARMIAKLMAKVINAHIHRWYPSFRVGSGNDPDAVYSDPGGGVGTGVTLSGGSAVIGATVGMSRSFSLTSIAGSASVTGPSGTFSSDDVGREITNGNLQVGSKILSVQSATAVTLDRPAKLSGTAACTEEAHPDYKGISYTLTSGAGGITQLSLISGNQAWIPGRRYSVSFYINFPYVAPGEYCSAYLYDIDTAKILCGISFWDQPITGFLRFEFICPVGTTSAINKVVFTMALVTGGSAVGSTVGYGAVQIDDLTAAQLV